MSDPFFSHDKFSKIFNHIMHDVLDVQATFPPIDIAEKNDKFVMAADIPGVKKEDISLDVHKTKLSISGIRPCPEWRSEQHTSNSFEKDSVTSYHIERPCGKFKRLFTLPDSADVDNIKASFVNGVLEVEIPKTERTRKTQAISIQDKQ